MRFDHEIKCGDETKRFNIIRDDKGFSVYKITELTENLTDYQTDLKFTQTDWLGGHGQYDFTKPDTYFEGQSIDTTQDGRVILGPLINQVGISGASLGANPICFCWFEAISKLMVAASSKVFWYDGTNFVEKKNITGKTVTDMVVYNDVLYVAIGSADKWYTSTDGVTFTITDLTNAEASVLFVAQNPAGTASVLWSGKTPNKLYYTTNGVAGGTALSTVAYIGDTTDNLTNIFASGDELMIGKLDNMFHYDSDGGVHPYMDDLKHNRSTNNFKYVVQWQGAIYFSLGTGIGELMGRSFRPVGPLNGIDDIGKVGTCVGLASDKDFLHIAVDEGTNTHIYKVREITRGNILRWESCPWVFLGTNVCATMKVVQHSATDRRLWFGYGDYAGYVILTDNPTADSAARFAASGWVRMSYEHGTDRYWEQLWQSVVLETRATTPNLTVTPKYRKDTDTTATQLTDAITSPGIVKSNLRSEVDCQRIQFELHLATNSSTSTPEVLHFEARGTERPEIIRVHDVAYEVGSNPNDSAKSLRDFFRDCRESTSLLRFADLKYKENTDGENFTYCVMMPGYPKEYPTKAERGRQREMGIQVMLREVSFT